MQPVLTVVVPAYDEAVRLGPTLRSILDFLSSSPAGEPFEVLVVDDGSKDATREVATGFAAEGVRVISHPQNRGKGAAVRTGLAASRGGQVLITDADLSTPIGELPRLVARLADADLVLGSRAVSASRITTRQPFYRELMGKTFNLLVRAAGVRGVHDTQCGFKLLTGDAARALAAEMLLDGFAYDVEMVFLARRHGLRVAEVGVAWANSPASKVRPVIDALAMFRDLVRMRWLHRAR